MQYDYDSKVLSVRPAGHLEVNHFSTHEEYGWISKPFNNWKKAVEKMKVHEKSCIHAIANKAALASEAAISVGLVLQQLPNADRQERMKSRAAIKAFIRCKHFIAHQHIPYTTNLEKLVDLVVSCGGEHLKHFLETGGKYAMYTSHVAVVDFVESLGMWVEVSKASSKSFLLQHHADRCTDKTTVEELSVFCHWEKNGLPVENFLEIIHLQKSYAGRIYSVLIDCLKPKHLQESKLVGMGFEGVITFSG